LAAAVAYRRGASVLVGGMCETDYSGYPDCRDNTLKALQVALSSGWTAPMTIETPLMFLDKAQTWALADRRSGARRWWLMFWGLGAYNRRRAHPHLLPGRSERHPATPGAMAAAVPGLRSCAAGRLASCLPPFKVLPWLAITPTPSEGEAFAHPPWPRKSKYPVAVIRLWCGSMNANML
jgi:hypothetical protein